MKSNLTDQDYKNILNFYKIPIPSTKRMLRLKSENILSSKMCKCIKKLDPVNESRSIGICSRSIFNRKGLTTGTIKCRGKQRVSFRKTRKMVNTRKSRKKI